MGYSFADLGAEGCRRSLNALLDLMCLILEVWQYMIISDLQGPVKGYWPLPWTQNYFIPNYLWNALSHLLSVLFGLIPLSVTQVWLNSTFLNFFLLLACLWQTLEGYARHRIKKIACYCHKSYFYLIVALLEPMMTQSADAYHTEAEIKWQPFSKRPFQMHFLEWNC